MTLSLGLRILALLAFVAAATALLAASGLAGAGAGPLPGAMLPVAHH